MFSEKEFFTEIQSKGLTLTEQQKNAVVHNQGPLLLLAVPGAGKTTVLTVRLAYLIRIKNIDPQRILCLTFSRAAAKEMRERFLRNFGENIPGEIHFSTIHSFAYEIVRLAFREKGKRFEIIEEQKGAKSKTGVLRSIYERHNSSTLTEELHEELQNTICFVKNALINPNDLSTPIKNFSQIFEDFEEYKVLSQPRLIDYDDMLTIAFQELKGNAQLLEAYRKRFDYILTDESQDTSLLQHKLIELVARPKCNLFVVGDDDQSIFGFRAADPKYLLNFQQAYPKAKILRMEQNFRSTPQIVDTSCQFIRTNTLRFDKTMYTQNPHGAALHMAHFKNLQGQYQHIIQELKRLKDLSTTGILFRNNLSALCLVEELSRANIPFYIRDSGKLRFFSHWAIQDILNFLRFSFSDKSLTVLERIWTKLPCRIPKQQLEQLYQNPNGRSLFDILSEHPQITFKQKQEYLELKEQFKKLNQLPPAQAIRFIRNELGYDKTLERVCDSLGFSEDYISGLLDILISIAQNEESIVDFANRLTTLEEQMKSSYKNKYSNAVTLSTLHSAKGLEWDQVYLVDLIDGIIPEREAVKASQSGEKASIEEERRLFYVGMTRARKYLTLCSFDFYYHKRVKPSRFVREVALVREGKKPKDINSNEASLLHEDWGVGSIVEHKTFGEGVIIKEEGNVILVQFQDGSQRTFLKDICEKQNLIWAI